VLTGFVNDEGNARGRPVGVAIDARGALLVADDVGQQGLARRNAALMLTSVTHARRAIF
jgi:glucose/arabinose dehydrogenase